MWMYCNLFIHLPDDGHLHCIYFWAVTNKATMNSVYNCLYGHTGMGKNRVTVVCM